MPVGVEGFGQVVICVVVVCDCLVALIGNRREVARSVIAVGDLGAIGLVEFADAAGGVAHECDRGAEAAVDAGGIDADGVADAIGLADEAAGGVEDVSGAVLGGEREAGRVEDRATDAAIQVAIAGV